MERRMKNNILLIGLGHFGMTVAKKLTEYKQDVMAVDMSEERVDMALPFVTNARIGNATDEKFVASLGVNDYDFCIVGIGDDFLSSLQTTALLKDYGAKYVVARATSDAQEKLLLRNGADRVVFPEKTLAAWTAIRFASNHIFDYLALDDQFSIAEIDVPKRWVGKTVHELDIRKLYHLNIIALKEDNVLIPGVDPTKPLTANQRLVVLGRKENIDKCFQ